MSVSGNSYVWIGHEQKSIKSVIENLPDHGWTSMSCGNGSKGDRIFDWQTLKINPGTTVGFERSFAD